MILLVEDNKDTVNLFKYFLKDYELDFAGTCAEALEKVKYKKYSLLMIDVNLPDHTGTYLSEEVRKVSDVPIFFITNYDTLCTKEIAEEVGARAFHKRDLFDNSESFIKEVDEVLENGV